MNCGKIVQYLFFASDTMCQTQWYLVIENNYTHDFRG